MAGVQNELSSTQNELRATKNELRNTQNELSTAQSTISSLQSELNAERNKVWDLQSQVSSLETQTNSLQSRLDTLLQVPHDYYSLDRYPGRLNRVDPELQDFLGLEFSLPTTYKRGIFDCSESAAYVEIALEDAGFNAYIVSGPTPWSPDTGYHAWVIAYASDYTCAIGPTALTGGIDSKIIYLLTQDAPRIIYGGDTHANGYYNGFDKSFKNIDYAVDGYRSEEEWNWWMGYWRFV